MLYVFSHFPLLVKVARETRQKASSIEEEVDKQEALLFWNSPPGVRFLGWGVDPPADCDERLDLSTKL